jgi:hypothetical protein
VQRRETFIVAFPPDFARIVALCFRHRQSKTVFLQLTLWGTTATSSHPIGPLRAKLTGSADGLRATLPGCLI